MALIGRAPRTILPVVPRSSPRPSSRSSPRATPIPLLLSLLVLLGSLVSTPLRAQTLWPTPLDTVRVVARRPDPLRALEQRSAFGSVIVLGDLAPAGRDLTDILDRTAGLQVHRHGGLGSFALASMRGSTPGQVLICVDGVPVASAGDGFVDLARLPASSFGRAEIYRGPQVASFGGPPAAGVINLVTPDAIALPLHLTVAGGSFGTGIARGQWGGARGDLSAFVSGQHRRSRGDFPYLNRNGTNFQNTADDRTERRANNDFQDTALLWKGTLRPWRTRHGPGVSGNALRVDYTGQRFDRSGGVPGTETIQTRHVRFETGRTRHQFALDDRMPFSWPLHLEAAVHHERIEDHFDNRDGEVGLAKVDAQNRTNDTGWRGALSVVIKPLRQEPRVTIDRRAERWTPYDRLRGIRGFTRTREHQTVSAEDRLTLGRLTCEASYRKARAIDNYAGPVGWGRPPEPSAPRRLDHEGPTFGARVDCGGGILVKANRGRLARFPSFPELFGQNGVQEGNPTLRPERGIQWDAGIQLAPDRPFRLEAAYFESLVEDQVVLLQNSQRTVKAMNLERAWVRGVESSGFTRVAWARTIALEMQGSFTWQEARDVGQSVTYRGKKLPDLPDREGFGSLRLLRGPWDARWEISARSSHYRDRYNSPQKRTPASTVHAVSLGRALARASLHLRCEVQNLFDERIEDIDGFPLPGRSFLAEVTYGMASGERAASRTRER